MLLKKQHYKVTKITPNLSFHKLLERYNYKKDENKSPCYTTLPYKLYSEWTTLLCGM